MLRQSIHKSKDHFSKMILAIRDWIQEGHENSEIESRLADDFIPLESKPYIEEVRKVLENTQSYGKQIWSLRICMFLVFIITVDMALPPLFDQNLTLSGPLTLKLVTTLFLAFMTFVLTIGFPMKGSGFTVVVFLFTNPFVQDIFDLMERGHDAYVMAILLMCMLSFTGGMIFWWFATTFTANHAKILKALRSQSSNQSKQQIQ